MLQETGVIGSSQQCKYCGCNMRISKQDKYVYWICQCRVDGIKCNRGKFSVHQGTFFDNSHLTVQNILWIVWHFVHHLNEKQCREYTSIGQKNKTTVVGWYRKCRQITNSWIRKNPPKLARCFSVRQSKRMSHISQEHQNSEKVGGWEKTHGKTISSGHLVLQRGEVGIVSQKQSTPVVHDKR